MRPIIMSFSRLWEQRASLGTLDGLSEFLFEESWLEHWRF